MLVPLTFHCHVYPAPEDAVSKMLPPGQKVTDPLGVIVAVGLVVIVTTIVFDVELPQGFVTIHL